MKQPISKAVAAALLFLIIISCDSSITPNSEMIHLLADVAKKQYTAENPFSEEAKLKHYDSMRNVSSNEFDAAKAEYLMGGVLLELGKEQKAAAMFEELLAKVPKNSLEARLTVMKQLAIAHLRIGERMNCIKEHSGESCIFPIAGRGIHVDKTGSEKAIEMYKMILQADPGDLESKWLLNIAYMTIGGYPGQVPMELLINGLDADTTNLVKPFIDLAVRTGLNKKNMAGGAIVDDFNNDGYLDIVTSSWGLQEGMHYCRNNSNGSFSDISDPSGLGALTGGLNIMQTDYNNDGLKDIFVLRGAWKRHFGKEPNSLLKNNGDGTFTDVTWESGLLSFHPTQTATWADFNNDGWLDVFIGNETSSETDVNPCELYMSNRNGTFTEVARAAGCNVGAFVKGVTSGDYNNDGLPDIFISTLNGFKILLQNEGEKNNVIHFKNVMKQAGLDKNMSPTFPTWFWDYDNDGWLDILASGYEYYKSLAWYSAAEAQGLGVGNSGKVFLFRNNHDGTFEDVSKKAGLNKIAFAMGANFGDIDNDGYLDIYMGTGNPLYQSLIPNKMFKNMNGQGFIDVTTSARVGNLQKGHGVSFADLDNDGDQDIYIEMGGAYVGDAYQNSLYLNPGQNKNHWINISVEGTTSNRAAIGAKIKVTFKEDGQLRCVYRDVNSGGSFGANPLLQHVGIGKATAIETIEIKWPGNNTTQVFKNLHADQHIIIKEGSNTITKRALNIVDFTSTGNKVIGCAPIH